MTQVMKGVRVLEVAQFTFVPAAGAILADWGADVIKIEHPVRGDTQRGFVKMGGVDTNPNRSPFVEHPNRGKRSVGVDISTPEGMEVIYELAKTADVFLTNYLPRQRQKMGFDIEHIRKINPNIIYARGSAFGDKGRLWLMRPDGHLAYRAPVSNADDLLGYLRRVVGKANS